MGGKKELNERHIVNLTLILPLLYSNMFYPSQAAAAAVGLSSAAFCCLGECKLVCVNVKNNWGTPASD